MSLPVRNSLVQTCPQGLAQQILSGLQSSSSLHISAWKGHSVTFGHLVSWCALSRSVTKRNHNFQNKLTHHKIDTVNRLVCQREISTNVIPLYLYGSVSHNRKEKQNEMEINMHKLVWSDADCWFSIWQHQAGSLILRKFFLHSYPATIKNAIT